MVQSPSWEANWFGASQEIPRISRNPKVHYRTHKRPPPVSILVQASPIQSKYPHPISWRSILILTTHLHLDIPCGLLPSSFPTKTLYTPLSSPIRATCPAHHILLYFITRTILGEEYKSFSSSLPFYYIYIIIIRTVLIKVLYSATHVQMNCLKNNFKFYIKTYIKTSPTCSAAVTPSSGSALLVHE